MRIRPARAGAAVTAALVAWAVAARLLPSGAPLGVIVLGLVVGGLTALTAIGLVLVYRSTRIVNFAQAEIGGLAASMALVMVIGWRLPYILSVAVGLATVATGWWIEATVVHRFFTAPRLILTVATIGIAQIIGAGEIELPHLFAHLRYTSTFSSGLTLKFAIGPVIFNGDDVLAMGAVPLAVAGLVWFFSRSDTGVAVRAAADSNERALLLGIPVRRLSRVTWMLAAGLSGVGAMLSVPVLGPQIGTPAGAVSLLAPLAAAAVGRMQSLSVTAAAALGIGIFSQVVFWNYGRSSTVDVGLFGVVLVALLLQRRRITRVDGDDLGGYVAVKEVRPIAHTLRRLPEVRWTRAVLWSLLAVTTLVVPQFLSAPRLILASYITIYGVIAVSLVVLTGWAGQISLGQFAFVGVGAATTGSLLVHVHEDLLLALLAAAAAGGVAAVIVGIPALRIQGLFLAVTTLAFAVPVSTFLLNSSYFPLLNPQQVNRPVLFQRWRLDSNLTFYYLCLFVLAVAMMLARNYRRTRPGRAMLATRDNERGAASFAIEPVRAKLVAFAFAGALAGLAGGLYSVGLRGVPYAGFSPDLSLIVFAMVVIGGLGSLPGALIGAVYVQSCQYFLHGSLQLLATGAGMTQLLILAPGGLGELIYAGRDRLLRSVARRHKLSVPSLAEVPVTADGTGTPAGGLGPVEGPSQLAVSDANASYGQIQVLFGVDVTIGQGEIVALLGTNGAGKSTLLRVIAGLLSAKPGRVGFEGNDITKLGPVERVRAGVVTVPGGRGVFGSLTVGENLRMAGWLARRDRAFLAAAEDRIFALFPVLKTRFDVQASLLSGGEQQMLTLAQALLCRPKLLLIDELSLGLAPSVVADLAQVVRQINAGGTTIVLVEQSVNLATSLASRAMFMEKGQVRFSGPIAELTERPDLLRSVFLRAASAEARPDRKAPVIAAIDRPTVLALDQVTRSFGGVTALRDVSLQVAAGQIFGIIGSNGAGKTTLFDICSGFLAADSGHMFLRGVDVSAASASQRADAGLGRSFQDARLFPSMTVVETLSTALERHVEVRDPWACIFGVGAAAESEQSVRATVEELIDTMGLGRYRDAFISELSTGTRRIVELAAVMAHRPAVVLLDEPSSGIAQREAEALGPLLVELNRATGAALVVIEHDIPLVSSIAESMVCMHLGRVIAEGAPAEVLSDPAVVASYLGTDEDTVLRSGSGPAPRRRRRPTVDA